MTTSPLIGRGHIATFGSEVPRLRGMTPSRFNTQTNHPLIHTNQGVVSMDGAQT